MISAVKEGAGRVRRHWRLGQIWCARQVWHMQHCCSVGEPRHPPTSFGLKNEQKRLLGDLNYPSIHFLCLRYPHLCHGRLKLEEKNKQTNKKKKNQVTFVSDENPPDSFLFPGKTELREGWFLIKRFQCSYSVYTCGPRSCSVGCPVAIITQSRRSSSKAELRLSESCLISVPYHSYSEHMAADEDVRAAHKSF